VREAGPGRRDEQKQAVKRLRTERTALWVRVAAHPYWSSFEGGERVTPSALKAGRRQSTTPPADVAEAA
jgi:hypothetical protein